MQYRQTVQTVSRNPAQRRRCAAYLIVDVQVDLARITTGRTGAVERHQHGVVEVVEVSHNDKGIDENSNGDRRRRLKSRYPSRVRD